MLASVATKKGYHLNIIILDANYLPWYGYSKFYSSKANSCFKTSAMLASCYVLSPAIAQLPYLVDISMFIFCSIVGKKVTISCRCHNFRCYITI